MGDPSDYYSVLNVPRDSSLEQIRKAYKALVRQWHPDKNPPSSKKEAEAKFKSITQAYEALTSKEYSSVFGVYNGVDGEGSKGDERWVPPSPSVYSSRAPMPSREPASQRYRREDPRSESSRALKGAGFHPPSAPATPLRKPSPVERKLECTLEELCLGCKKVIKVTRDVVDRDGMIVKKEEVLNIRIEPGWKKGTKVTFEGKGDEWSGCIAADVIFLISEKEHPFYKRVGDDLVLKVEIPLVNALTGWTFSFRLLSGEKMSCSFCNEIIHPGYEKVIKGQGMPVAHGKGVRGDLRIKFLIVFPKQLTEEQRLGIVNILKDSS